MKIFFSPNLLAGIKIKPECTWDSEPFLQKALKTLSKMFKVFNFTKVFLDYLIWAIKQAVNVLMISISWHFN